MTRIRVSFESLRPSTLEAHNFYASEFDAILTAQTPSEVIPLLREVERLTKNDYYAFGFVCYEARFAFLPEMAGEEKTHLPLAWFALTKTPEFIPQPFTSGTYEIRNLSLNKSAEEYDAALAAIRNYIERGDTYQVNYTLRYRGDFSGSARLLYQDLKTKQQVSYAASIETEEWSVISLSPELFFRRAGEAILMRPMKGTAARGRTSREDQIRARELSQNLKERAENLMIVDMLRNDLGKICETGSVRVTREFEVERYETLLQMTSSIEGRLRQEVGLADIFQATFPSGSITGAPKIRTMQIIQELEREPRGIYTGAIGYAHGSETVFSVAIRTVLIDRTQGKLELGVGSGILHEANPQREYEECRLKANFLTEPKRSFELIETMLWIPGEGYRNISYHIERLLDSADYFLFQVDPGGVKSRLENFAAELPPRNDPQRVRLLLSRNGEMQVESHPFLPLPDTPVRIGFARKPQDSSNIFLFHKTTNRSFYETEYQEARKAGFFDVIFRNQRDEITEGAISNVFILKNRKYYTSPVSCGLLAGTFRRQLLERGEIQIHEKVLYEKDLREADAIFVTNAIRGMLPAVLVGA